jgi:hypothetical protein
MKILLPATFSTYMRKKKPFNDSNGNQHREQQSCTVRENDWKLKERKKNV